MGSGMGHALPITAVQLHQRVLDPRPARRSLLAHGNLDLRDSLVALRLNGTVVWNGINELTRRRDPACTVLVRHETAMPFATLLTPPPPPGLIPDDLPLGPFPLRSQFSRAVFAPGDAAVVLSIQADVTAQLARHRQTGALFHPYDVASWPVEHQRWLREGWERLAFAEPAASMTDLAAVIARIRATADVPVLVFNVSAHVPGDTVHAYAGLPETLATRIRRFTLALIELAVQLDFSIIDVDRIVAGAGARALQRDTIHLSAEGCRLIAHEVERVLDDYGWWPSTSSSA